jgi:hypothetical protein
MKVSDSPTCVAYYFKQKYPYIAGAINDPNCQFDEDFLKRYVICQVDKAKKTRTQQRIRKEIVDSGSLKGILSIVDRVIANGDTAEFIDYAKSY